MEMNGVGGSCLGGSRRKICYVDPWYWLYVAGFWRTCQFWLHHLELRPLILYMNRIPMKQAVDRCNFRENLYDFEHSLRKCS